MRRQMLAVERVEVGEQSLLGLPLQLRRRIEIQNPRLLRADDGPLIERRQPAVRPVVDSAHRQAAGIGQHDERGQVLRLAPQGVGEPDPSDGRPEEFRPCSAR